MAETLKSGHTIRFEAARALIQIGGEAVENLVDLLSHADEDGRIKAAGALGMIGDEKAVESQGKCFEGQCGG